MHQQKLSVYLITPFKKSIVVFTLEGTKDLEFEDHVQTQIISDKCRMTLHGWTGSLTPAARSLYLLMHLIIFKDACDLKTNNNLNII